MVDCKPRPRTNSTPSAAKVPVPYAISCISFAVTPALYPVSYSLISRYDVPRMVPHVPSQSLALRTRTRAKSQKPKARSQLSSGARHTMHRRNWPAILICAIPVLALASNTPTPTPSPRPRSATIEERESRLSRTLGSRFPIRRRSPRQLPPFLRRRSIARGAHHSRSALSFRQQRPQSNRQLHHRNRRPRPRPAHSGKRRPRRGPSRAANCAHLEISPRHLQRRSHRDRRQNRIFQPIAPVQSAGLE